MNIGGNVQLGDEVNEAEEFINANESENEIHPLVEPIYIMTVELDEGRSQTIKIYADSTPNELAFEFCKEHNLDVNAMIYLSEQIKILLDELTSSRVENRKEQENVKNSGNIKGVFNNNADSECIQEVDEEEYQTDTRKTNKSGNNKSKPHTPNSGAKEFSYNIEENPSEHEEDAKIREINLDPEQIHNDSLPIDGCTPAVHTKKLEDADMEDMINHPRTKHLIYSKSIPNKSSHINQEEPQNSQRLFSYQVFYDNFKHKNSDVNLKQRSIASDKNGSLKSEKRKPKNIFENLFKNSEVKTNGVNIKPSSIGSSGLDSKILSQDNVSNNGTSASNFYRKEFLQFNTSQEFKGTNRSQLCKRDESGMIINYGERLYIRGVKKREEREKRAENFRREREEINSSLYTHKPRINEISPEVMKRRNDTLLNYTKDDYVRRYNQYLEEKTEKLKRKYQKREEYSFAPMIDKNSSRIAEERMQNRILARSCQSASPDVHRLRIEELYALAKTKEMKIKELDKQFYPFKYQPLTNLNSPKNNIQKLTENAILNMTFSQRLEVFRQKSEEKKKMRENYASNFDPKTGQSLFMPKLMSTSNSNFNTKILNNSSRNSHHTSDIFNQLYSYAQKFTKNKIDKQMEFDSTIKKSSKEVHTATGSEHVFNKKKEEIFTKLFKLMDSDEDDRISTVSMNTKKIPKNILKILSPILEELKEENETLNENEFVTACKHLYDMLSYEEKKIFLELEKLEDERKPKRGISNTNFTFQPKIDKKSKRIAESKQFTYSYSKTNVSSTANDRIPSMNSSISEGYAVWSKKYGKSSTKTK